VARYHHRLERLTREIGQDPADLLALVLAHEIGHILRRLADMEPSGPEPALTGTD
jgi:hypothetical protein